MKRHDYHSGGAFLSGRCSHQEDNGDGTSVMCLQPVGSDLHTLHEHVILVAVNVLTHRDREHAERVLLTALTDLRENPAIDSWWVAEDSRTDNSDAESAVFVPKGMSQAEADAQLRRMEGQADNGCAPCRMGEHGTVEDGRCLCCGARVEEVDLSPFTL